MCGGVSYTIHGVKETMYFPNPYAQLPLLHKDGSVHFYPWGRRAGQVGNLPKGGWARQDSIRAGKWQYYYPLPVKIVVDAYMEKNFQDQSIWYDLKQGHYIQGLLAKLDGDIRVYIVTVQPEFELKYTHKRLPRIVHN